MRHIEEDGGQLGGSVASPHAKEAAAVGLDQQSNPLEDFVQGFLHLVGAMHLLYELEDELGLLDGGGLLVRRRIFDLHLVVESSSDHICLDFLFVVLLCKLRVVVEELLHSVFVCHSDCTGGRGGLGLERCSPQMGTAGWRRSRAKQ